MNNSPTEKIKTPICNLGKRFSILSNRVKIHVICMKNFAFEVGAFSILILLVYFPLWQIKDFRPKIESNWKIPKLELVLSSVFISWSLENNKTFSSGVKEVIFIFDASDKKFYTTQ